MTRTKKTVIAILALVVVVVLAGYGVRVYLAFAHDWKSEYTTASTIAAVTRYVETHEGRWPTNWDEIESFPGDRDLVVVQFEVDVERLMKEPEPIQSTIVPVTGEYNKFPHARIMLEELRQTLIRSQPAKTPK